jgi:hypothetical protein
MATMSFISASKLVELVKAANKGGEMYVRVVSGNRLALGNDPMNPTVSIDLSKEAVGPYKNEPKVPAVEESQPQANRVRANRRSGEYWFELHGKRLVFGSLRELLGQSLRSIEAERPGTLEKLSHIKPKSKRIVAREKKLLFESEHLSDNYGDELMAGWWYGINNSSEETSTWLERACGCAGLKWGKDFSTSLSD